MSSSSCHSFSVAQFQLLDYPPTQRHFAEVQDRLLGLVLHLIVDPGRVQQQVDARPLVILAGNVTERRRGRGKDDKGA